MSRASERNALTATRRAWSSAIPWISERSTLMKSGRSSRTWRSDAKPAPASSTAMRRPCRRRGASCAGRLQGGRHDLPARRIRPRRPRGLRTGLSRARQRAIPGPRRTEDPCPRPHLAAGASRAPAAQGGARHRHGHDRLEWTYHDGRPHDRAENSPRRLAGPRREAPVRGGCQGWPGRHGECLACGPYREPAPGARLHTSRAVS
jgi:hypothetical protein